MLFVSHCLLNENVRYLGGATRPGAVVEVVRTALEEGVGLVQMPCPEQRAWGGVLKTRMLEAYGRAWLARHGGARRRVARAVTVWTRLAVAPLARRVAADVADYRRSGMTVVGIVGVGASPSCGVTCTIDLPAALGTLASCPLAELTAEGVNRRVVMANTAPGTGLFTDALRAALRRRHLAVPFFEHDLIAELRGEARLPEGLPQALRRRT